MKYDWSRSPGSISLYILSFVLFEPAIKCVGTQAHLLLKPYCCYGSRLPLLIKLTELYPVYRLRLPSFIFSLSFCNSDTFTLALQGLLTFELRECSEDRQHKASLRSVSIDVLFAADKRYLFSLKHVYNVEQISCRTPEPTDA